jgi:2'-5' RNA ligase
MRLFIAVNLPESVRHAAWQAAEPLRAGQYPVRWVVAESLHITTKFLGEVPSDGEEAIVAGIHAAVEGAKPFPVTLSEFGAFPSLSRPRVMWVGCEAAPPFELLQHRVEREMDRLGFPVEGRAFHPHITIGRVKRDARPSAFGGLAEVVERLEFAASVTVESLDLMESTLTRHGARYALRHAIPLSATEGPVR